VDLDFRPSRARDTLHESVTRTLALRVIQAERAAEPLLFPNEAGLCRQLDISRSILREAVKVLADKGMVEVRPRSGTRSRPRAEWNLLDSDILSWEIELEPDARLLRDLCEVRLAIEPTASGFAALRASARELGEIQRCLDQREISVHARKTEEAVALGVQFQAAVVEASHNALFRHLNSLIRRPLEIALSRTGRAPASLILELESHRTLFEAIRKRDPLAARAASERIVGLAMLASERVLKKSKHKYDTR
jgi:DNA-binding FadR family transcriptional regulator